MFQISLPQAIVFADVLGALGILAASLLVAWLVRLLFRKLAKRARGTTTPVLDDLLLGALSTPAFLAIALTGLYLGLAYLPLDPSSDHWIRRGLFLALAATGIYAVLAVTDAFLRWYGLEVAAS